MLREISFTIFQKPIPQKRHRHTKRGVNYDPSSKDKLLFRKLLSIYAKDYPSLNEGLLQGPLIVDMKFYFELPKTKSSRKKKGLYYIQHPDTDNLCKFVLDAMNGVLYDDDRQIFKIIAAKYYTNDKPRTEVTIKEVLQEPVIPEKECNERQSTFVPARLPYNKKTRV